MKNILYAIAVLVVVSSCEDVINPTLPDADPVLVIDAWVSNEEVPQSIFVTRTQPYFENEFPEKVDGAT
ncbi:MAG: DUF4249 domain-containing protein, partial [Cyclobacteriaceae bacterium]